MDRPPREKIHCPFCGEGPRMVEKVGREWFCNSCGKSWRFAPIDELDVRDVNGVVITDP